MAHTPQTSVTPGTPVTPGSIVVGIDGSASSGRALGWAARQAALEHRTLALVHAAHLGATGDVLWGSVPGVEVARVLDDLAQTGRALLEEAAERVRREEPGVEVQQVLSTDDPRSLLLGGSAVAAMTVLGSRGRGLMTSLLLGSVSLAVSKHATGPVVVVRESEPGAAHGRVVVDVDGTADSLPAIELAYHTAAFRSLPLTALHVFWDAVHRDSEEHVVHDDEPGLGDVRALLAESVAGMQEKYPEVQDRLVLERGFRDRQLVRAAESAVLVVVGARRRGLLDDFLHSSVAATVVEHARCDVAVVPS